jgi:hypothetical protein
MERRETGPTVILLPSEGKMCERPNEDTFGRSLSVALSRNRRRPRKAFFSPNILKLPQMDSRWVTPRDWTPIDL